MYSGGLTTNEERLSLAAVLETGAGVWCISLCIYEYRGAM